MSTQRRRFFARALGTAGALVLAGCDKLSRTDWFPKVLNVAEPVNNSIAKTVARMAMAEEFPESALSPSFRSNGTSDPGTDAYVALAQGQFATYKLVVDGLVENPLALTLADVRALPSREQITRHDCVEGWSAIARWKGARLSAILAAAKPKANARYVVFHCADPMNEDGTGFYYESIDFEDAYHEQTILAYDLNRAPLPIANGAPLRLRVERQLGYKQAKYLLRLELVESFAHIEGGNGGYWEDNGYQWFAGI
ncbi:MAG: molybdopterin-dependent oxidoreductase [Proteobacteria bacterium]|nr:molybdopterin-dependent oxidoreductase [Pseudomonadota bacterium]